MARCWDKLSAIHKREGRLCGAKRNKGSRNSGARPRRGAAPRRLAKQRSLTRRGRRSGSISKKSDKRNPNGVRTSCATTMVSLFWFGNATNQKRSETPQGRSPEEACGAAEPDPKGQAEREGDFAERSEASSRPSKSVHKCVIDGCLGVAIDLVYGRVAIFS